MLRVEGVVSVAEGIEIDVIVEEGLEAGICGGAWRHVAVFGWRRHFVGVALA